MSNKKNKTDKKTEYEFPSRFGSHKLMVVKDFENGIVICKDEFGEYETKKSILDTGLADVNRFDLQKREVKFS